MSELVLWPIFTAIIVALLAVDLFLIRDDEEVSIRKALVWSAFWTVMALGFAVIIYFALDGKHAVEFLTGYVIERSLSIDNLFVFLVIFQFLAVSPRLQGRALTIGIIGALVLRLGFILIGAALLQAFDWMVFVFGGLLILTALRLAFEDEQEMDIEKNVAVRLLRRFVPVTTGYQGSRLFMRLDGQLMVTPMVIVVVAIATTDIIFAIDSIPAIFAVTSDAFIVYSSNAFAVLGMRALYFAIASLITYFTYLRQGLVVVLAFVGVKMLISDFYEVPTLAALGVVLGILLVAMLFSVLLRKEAPVGAEQEASARSSETPS